MRQRIKSIIKQNQALRSRMVIFKYISENPEQTPERREETKKDGKKSNNLWKKRGRKKGASRRTWHKKRCLEKTKGSLSKGKSRYR